MAAIIRTTLHEFPGGPLVPPVLTGVSRNDLRKGYEVTCFSVNAATTYQWTLSFIPTSPGSTNPATPNTGTPSTATLVGATLQTATFVVDWEGSYLLRLTVDAGLPTEDTQFVRIRYLTKFADLKLVAAGERRDGTGIVPVDADATAWANDQNQNLQRLMLLARRVSSSGRVLFVDANRGRDRSNTPNVETNLVYIPGPDTAAVEETGTKFGAEGFGDFSDINTAIAYAAAAAVRGEAALSFDDPYWIVIQPGYYQEDLALVEHVHLIGASGGFYYDNSLGLYYDNAVIIETTVAGAGPHTFGSPGGMGSPVYLENLTFINSQNTTDPLFEVTGGVLCMNHCQVFNFGLDGNQGEVILAADPANTIYLNLVDTHLYGRVSDPVVELDGLDAGGYLLRTRIEGPGYGIEYNRTLSELPSSTLEAHDSDLGAYHGYGTLQSFQDCNLASILVEPFGAGPASKLGSVALQALNIVLTSGTLSFDAAGAVGATALSLGNVSYSAIPSGLALTSGPPTLLVRAGSHGESHPYQNNYDPPEDPGTGLPAAIQLPANYDNIQRTIDYLIRVVHPVNGAPFYSLDSSYDGLATMYPLVFGDGGGRSITADAGAVIIQGNPAPTDPHCAQLAMKHGGLQMEGILDIGPIIVPVAPTTDTNVMSDNSIRPSEIQLNPNHGAGPMISMGASIWPNDVTPGPPVRGLPAALLTASTTYVGGVRNSYHLQLRTAAHGDSATDYTGELSLHSGSVRDTGTKGVGDVHIGAGHILNPANAYGAGKIYLAPGVSANPLTPIGRVYVVGANGTGARLQAAGAFAGGTDGTFWVATPYGVEAFTVAAGDNLVAVLANINANSQTLIASDAGGGVLRLTFIEPGFVGDVLYVTDDQTGALNTALGDLTITGGATFTPGAYGDSVGLSCPAPNVLQVDGAISGGVLGTWISVTNVMSPYAADGTYEILGCATLTGAIQINLSNAVAAGTKLIIKDEDGNAAANNITLVPQGGSTIDGAPNFPIAANYAAAAVYFNGTNWFIY